MINHVKRRPPTFSYIHNTLLSLLFLQTLYRFILIFFNLQTCSMKLFCVLQTCLMILFLFYRRVLRKLDLDLSDDVIRALANTTNPKPRVIEKVLMLLRMQIDKFLERQGRSRWYLNLHSIRDKIASIMMNTATMIQVFR
jgi:hypothetical protein